MTVADCRKQAIQRGLKVGQKVKIVEKERLHNRESRVVRISNGVITAFYPHIFTVEMIGKHNNIIRTNFQYVQVIIGEIELRK